jgi:hypothetical protein
MRATLAACCGRAAAADSSHSAAQGSSEASRPSPRPHTMTTQRGYRQLPRRAILACTQPLPVDLPTANDLPRRRPSSTLRWPSTAFASFEGQAPTSGRRPTVVDIAGDHADPGHPSRAAAGLIATPRDLIPVGHSGHPERTDVGGRTLDTWTLRRPHRTPATWQAPVGHRTLAPDTGHRMPDTNVDTVTTAQPASGPPWPPGSDRTPRRPTVFVLSHYQPAAQPLAGQAAPRRIALLKRESPGVRQRWVGG